MSKHNPVMKQKSPVSWLNNDEGLDAMNKFNGNANKGADYLVNKHIELTGKEELRESRNAIKKWLDRVIRRLWRKNT